MSETMHVEREQVEKEMAYAAEGNRHRSVRLVTVKRVLVAADEKTEALKEIHRICNAVLDGEGAADFETVKRIRELASGAWLSLCRAEGRS